MKIRAFIPLAGAMLLANAASASAFTDIFTGTVTAESAYVNGLANGVDYNGLFGAPGASLVGDKFQEVFTIDTSQGIVNGPNVNGVSSYRGPLTGVLTINGASYTVGSEVSYEAANIGISRTGNFSEVYVYAYTGNVSDTVSAELDGGVDVLSVNSAFPQTFGAPFNLVFGGSSQGRRDFLGIYGSVPENLDLTVDSAFSAGVSAAPEPSTWALMITGLAMIGGALRFSRRQQRAALAL